MRRHSLQHPQAFRVFSAPRSSRFGRCDGSARTQLKEPVENSASTSTSCVSPGDLSVVICCYTLERWHDLLAAVHSVQLQHSPPGQIIVVVDHNDQLLDRLVDALPGVDVIPNTEQRGLAGARNSGVSRSSGTVVAFLDDDAMAEPRWTEELLRHYSDSAVLGVGGTVRPQWPHVRPRWFPAEFDWVVGCSFPGQPVSAAPVRNFIGANMSLRREVFDRVGGFSHALGRVGKHPVGCEETELCIRVSRSFPGKTLLHAPNAAVRHKVAPARTCWSYFWRRCRAGGISKAVVTRLAGAGPALASERKYIRVILPRGIWTELRAAVAGDAFGLARAASIVLGLAVTMLGYAQGRMTRGRGSRD